MSLNILPAATPRAGRRRRNLPAGEWRARIQEAARMVVLRDGYEGTTMEEVARVAGISRARLYSLYPSRREVLADILAEDARSLAGEVLLRISSAPGVEEKLHGLVAAFFDFAGRADTRARILYAGGEHADPVLWTVLAEVRRALIRVLRLELATVMDGDTAVAGDLAAGSLIALAEGAASAWAIDRSMPQEAAVATAVRLARNALGLAR